MPENPRPVARMCFILMCFVPLLLVVLAGSAHPAIPQKINYQARLTDSSTGEPLVGPQSMTFRIYDQASGGSLLWTESQTVAPDSEGIASAILGSMVPLDISFGEAAWLEVVVNGQILLPRREMVSVPYAFQAEVSDSSQHADSSLYAQSAFDAGRALYADGAGDSDSLGGFGADEYLKSGEAWTGTNDGAGSGLDADFLDGLNGDAFADTGHAHDERYRRNEELEHPGTINQSGNPVDWTKLKNVPGGLADGVDDAGGAGDGHSLDAADGSPVDVVYVSDEGRIGIGNTEPVQGKLEVWGETEAGVYAVSNSGTGVFGWSSSGTGVSGVSLTGRAADFDGNVYVNGRLGIGTDSPTVSLDVQGAVSADTVYMMRGQPVLRADLTYGAVAVGAGASNFRMAGWTTMVGHEAGYNNHMGDNTFVGYRAGYANADGNHNTFVGSGAGEGNESGMDNTIIGSNAGPLIDGPGNTIIGAHSTTLCPSGAGNTFVGDHVAESLTFGTYNTFVGRFAGGSLENGSNNVFLGYMAGEGETGSGKLYISNDSDTSSTLIYGDFSNGRIGLGTLSPERKLHIRGSNPRILIDAYASNPEINFKNAGDGPTHTWAIYKESGTDDLRFYRGGDRVTLDAATGNVGIGTSEPTSRLHVAGDIHCTGKLTSDGGNDPPYVLYDKETRTAIVDRVAREVPEDKLDGAVLFWNGDESSFEVYLPSRGEFRDLMGNVLAEVSSP